MLSANEELLNRVGGKNLVGWHRENGKDIEAFEYLERYQRLLISGLNRTRLIYLDTNYWVRLRDAELGRGTADAVRLLQTLRAMIRSREILCVSHFQSFLEISKQEEASLRASARLLDEFTDSIAIASPADIVAWECAEFIRAKLNLDLRSGLCVWTKVGQIHTNGLPAQMPGPTTHDDDKVILKSLIDAQWSATFEEIFKQFDWKTKDRLNASIDPEVFAQVEARKREKSIEKLSREEVRQHEFSQVASGQLRPVFSDLLIKWCDPNDLHQGLAALSHLQTVINSAINEFKSRTLGQFLPCVVIPVELYSLYETNYRKQAPLTNNDYVDWGHAAAALAYCDMFFTERHLAHQLCQELKADQQYECEVFGTLEDALNTLHDKCRK